MKRKIPFILKTIILVFAVSFSTIAQVKRTNEDLIKLVDKNLSSPIEKNVNGNGDVFLQRSMNDFLSNTDLDRKAAIKNKINQLKPKELLLNMNMVAKTMNNLPKF